MKSFVVYSVLFCFVVCFASCLAEPKEPKRSKMTSVYALTPSLRVGRRSENAWDTFNSGRDRRNFMMIPLRTGRSDSTNFMAEDNNYGAKRPGSGPGMWFGPRLGRLHKRNDASTPWTYIILNGDGPVSRQVYTPRLGRESEETYDLDADVVA